MRRKSKFANEQSIRALRESDGGAKQGDVARRLGVTEQTIYRWKERLGGMQVNWIKELKRRTAIRRTWGTHASRVRNEINFGHHA
ncbi:MAG: transposase family protein [Myxococcales bacterium]|nr:transposase family protein [Myxococcales bacterium]